MEDGLNPVVLEPGLCDVVERLLDRRLDGVDILHRNALKADAEKRVSDARFVTYQYKFQTIKNFESLKQLKFLKV